CLYLNIYVYEFLFITSFIPLLSLYTNTHTYKFYPLSLHDALPICPCSPTSLLKKRVSCPFPHVASMTVSPFSTDFSNKVCAYCKIPFSILFDAPHLLFTISLA